MTRHVYTAADRAYLLAHWGLHTDAQCAAHLGVSPAAVALYVKRHLRIDRRANLCTQAEVTAVTGWDHHTIARLVASRVLVRHRAGNRTRSDGRASLWHFPLAGLLRAVETHPWLFDRQRLAEGHFLTQHYDAVTAGDPWWTVPQAGAALGYSYERLRVLLRAYRAVGVFRHEWRPRRGARGGDGRGLIVARRSAWERLVATHTAAAPARVRQAMQGRCAVRTARAAAAAAAAGVQPGDIVRCVQPPAYYARLRGRCGEVVRVVACLGAGPAAWGAEVRLYRRDGAPGKPVILPAGALRRVQIEPAPGLAGSTDLSEAAG